MKHFLILIAISCLMVISCGSLYTPAPKTNVTKAGTYEGGNKANGVVYLSLTYQPLKENVTVDGEQTEENASQICRNWGYTGAKLQAQDQYLSKCIQFNWNTGDCVIYKTDLKAVCY